MHKRLNLSHHQHSGKVLPHHHTSWGGLLLIVVFAGILLSGISFGSLAASPPPQSGYVGLTGKMPAAPPKTGATITTPRNGQHFGISPVTVSGTCPENTIVELEKNNIFAGSGLCSDKQTFSFDVDLLYGQNDLVAKVFDALDQPGPDSNTVTVFYDALPPQADPLSNLSFDTQQLLIRTSPVYRGIFPGQPLSLPLELLGGSAPFAVNVTWGDGKSTLMARNDNVPFDLSHTYEKPGSYQVIIQVTDAKQRVAFLITTVIVNGKAEILAANAEPPAKTDIKTRLIIIWPIYALIAALVFGFFTGEYREKRKLIARYNALGSLT